MCVVVAANIVEKYLIKYLHVIFFRFTFVSLDLFTHTPPKSMAKQHKPRPEDQDLPFGDGQEQQPVHNQRDADAAAYEYEEDADTEAEEAAEILNEEGNPTGLALAAPLPQDNIGDIFARIEAAERALENGEVTPVDATAKYWEAVTPSDRRIGILQGLVAITKKEKGVVKDLKSALFAGKSGKFMLAGVQALDIARDYPAGTIFLITYTGQRKVEAGSMKLFTFEILPGF
jgi:hypothetical protein